jgi:uncharacterized membrane protein
MSNRSKLPRNNKPNNTHQPPSIQTQTQVTHYQGAIPPPEILRGFEELVPGTAARLIALAEDESAHRRQVENKALDANIALQEQNVIIAKQQNKVVNRSDIMGQFFGFIICISCVGAAIFLGINGHDELAGAITVIPSAAVIKAFFSSKNHQQQNKPSDK